MLILISNRTANKPSALIHPQSYQAYSRRNPLHDSREQAVNIQPRLGRNPQRTLRIQLKARPHLLKCPLRIRRRQVNFINNRHEIQSLGKRLIKVRNGLRLNTLTRINKQQRATTRRITPRHLGPEIHMARRVDQMQQVILPLVVPQHGARLRLHRDPALALDVEFVEDLLVRALLDRPCELEQPV